MSLGTQIIESIDRWGFEFKVSLPVIVLDVNADKSLVRCRVAVLDRTMAREERLVDYPEHIELVDVPVAHYSTSKGYVWTDIEPDTHGRIIFSDVDLQRYINLAEVLDPASTRFHDWNDSYFVPGEFSFARRIDPIDADIGLSNIDGTSGAWVKDGELRLYGSPIFLNDVEVTGVNGISATPVPPVSPAPPKEVRR